MGYKNGGIATGFLTVGKNFQRLYPVRRRPAGQELIKAQLKILAEENTELKKQLSFKQRAKAPQMAAEVVGKNTDSADKTIIINVGEEAGLKVDQPVVAGDGILVGKITKVEKQLAVVRLISDNQIKVAATVLNNERSLGWWRAVMALACA